MAAATLAVSTVVALLLPDLATAFAGRDWRLHLRTDPRIWRRQHDVVDPELQHVHRPHSSYRGRVRANLCRLGVPERLLDVDVRYDANGFRNEPTPERVDVAVVGDSFVEAPIVPVEASFAHRLGDLLGCTTANLGQSGYGPQQELAVLRRFALPLRPAVVTWVFFGGNDLQDVDAYERRARGEAATGPPGSLWARSFVRNLPLWFGQRFGGDEARAWAELRRGAWRSPGGEGEQYFSQPEHRYEERQLDVALDCLRSAAAECRAAGARLVVVYVPRKFRVYRGLCEFPPGSPCADWETTDLPDRVAAFCAEQDLGWVDLTPVLRERVEQGVEVHFPEDVHWNPAGHDAAAGAVARFLERAGWPRDG